MKNHAFIIFFICVLGLLGYSNSFQVPFLFDDLGITLLRNPTLQEFNSLSDIWNYYPGRFFGMVSFGLNLHLVGYDVFSFHVVNFLVHIITSILVFLLIKKVFVHSVDREKSRDIHNDLVGAEIAAALAAFVFVSHPLNVQAVTYICQRFSSMLALFYLGSVLLYFHYAEKRKVETKESRYYLVGAGISAFFAMFTKENSATLPISWLLVEVLFFDFKLKKGIRIPAGLWVGGVLMLLPVYVLFVGANPSFLDTYSESAPPRIHYFLSQIHVLKTYLRLFVWPFEQNLDYDYPLITSFWSGTTWAFAILHTTILATAYFFWHRLRGITFGIIFYYLTIAPESSIIPLPDLIFEHRMYLPSIGLIMVLGSTFYFVLNKKLVGAIEKYRAYSAVILLFLGIAVLPLTYLTFQRNEVWNSAESLWFDVTKKSPGKPRAHQNLGNVYLHQGQFREAMQNFTLASKINPEFSGNYNNIGVAAIQAGESNIAIKAFLRAIALNDTFPSYKRNLGHAYQVSGKPDKAIEILTQCIAKHPKYVACQKRLAKIRSNK